MSLQVSAIPPLKQHVAASRKFKSAEYHSTIWGDQFLEYSKSADDISNPRRYEELKEEVRKVIIDGESRTTSQKLCLIDAVQRLGVGYHFTSEIEDELNKIALDCNGDSGLYTAALRFRLLRQQGIRASSDTFQMFRDSRGRFKASLNTDVKALLSLYEAAHLAIRGEDILDEALDFAITNLKSQLSNLNSLLAQEVQHALNRPIRKCLPRLEARHYIVAYSREESQNKNLLEFAKLDFCLSQRVHQKELSDISQWWTNLEVASRLPYARDRIVELYFWIMGVYFEPQFSLGRKIMTKVIAMLSILDDTYDNYATCEELELFTEAIQRWDVMMIDMLPEYMKMIYGILIDVYNKIEEDMAKEGRPPYCVHYAKEAMKRTVRFYFTEAKWRDRGYVPNMKEYMDVSLVSSCYPLLITTSFLGMGPIATQEAFEWACNDPKIIKASAVVCRFMDDIASHEFEQQRNHVASSVECYMKQHSSPEEETVKFLRKEIANAWKDINEECLKPTTVPMPLLERALNFARVIDVIYKDGDGYTNPHLIKDYVASLLKHSVPV